MTGEKSAGADSARAQSVTELHEKWRGILNRLDSVPGLPTPGREARLAEAGRLEREIGRAHARDTEEIILKLRMVLSGRTTAALSEAGLLAGAIEDLRRADP